MKKIVTPAGKYVILASREEASAMGHKYTSVSSTEAQPYISFNFNADGTAVGGRTMSETDAQALLARAEKEGWEIV